MRWGTSTSHDIGGESHTHDELTIGNVEFTVSNLAIRPSEPRHFSLMKDRAMTMRYAELVERLNARRVVELGIYHGGSAAFIALLPQVEQLVAFELDHGPVADVLQQFATDQGLGDGFHMCFGVDQADGDTMLRELDRVGIDEIDLVTDDASHMYEPTLASFNALFPRVRPGGAYVIEDWRGAVVDMYLGPDYERRANIPLTTLAFQLVMASGAAPGIVQSVDIDATMIVVTRGPDPIDAQSFTLNGLYNSDAADLLGDWRTEAT